MGECGVRIVAGAWRGRPIKAPAGRDTRPTADRVREALFSSLVSLLGADLGGRVVLDAFAGSGALALEALSRGASHAVLLESDRGARAVAEENVRALAAESRARVVAGDAFAAAERGGPPGGPFGLLFADPPYRIEPARVRRLLEALTSSGMLEGDAVVAYEHASDAVPSWPDGFEDVRTRRYGSTAVSIAIYRTGVPAE